MDNQKYKNGKIYKLVSTQTDEVYYGSTIDSLPKRKSKHKYSYKQWLENKCKYTASFELFKFGDVEIVLVESFPCNSKYELFAREWYYIENNKCVNKCNPSSKNIDVKRVICKCGVIFNKKGTSRHNISNKHLLFVNNQFCSSSNCAI
jgi:hypothetical protein